jgi:hypothetical protein
MAEEKYLAEYEKSAAGNYLKRSRGTLINVISQGAADRTLIEEESGSTVLVTMTGNADKTVTLPAAKAGLNFKFVVAASPSGSGDLIIASAVADTIVGLTSADAAADGASNTAADTVTIEAASIGGEVIECLCDGTKWYAFAHQSAVGSITLAG